MSIRNVEIVDLETFSTDTEKLNYLLTFASFAPSTHNIQPWKVKETKKNMCILFPDTSKQLPEADRTNRGTYISLGCFAENFITALKYFGVFKKSNIIQNKNQTEIHVSFDFNKAKINNTFSAAMQGILTRQTTRTPYIKVPIPKNVVNKVISFSDKTHIQTHLVTKQHRIEKVAEIASQAIRKAYARKQFRKELGSLVKPNSDKSNIGIPGYALNMNLPMSYILPFAIKHFDMSPILAKVNQKAISTSSGICFITTSKNTPKTWVEIGMLAEKIMIYVTQKNYQIYISVAAIEVGTLYKEIQTLLNTTDRPIFMFAFGKTVTTNPFTTRKPVEISSK